MDFKIPKLIHEPDGRGERNLGLDFERERERERESRSNQTSHYGLTEAEVCVLLLISSKK